MPTPLKGRCTGEAFELLKDLRVSEELLRRAAQCWNDIFVTVQDDANKIVVCIADNNVPIDKRNTILLPLNEPAGHAEACTPD
jgi:hypothetical protein